MKDDDYSSISSHEVLRAYDRWCEVRGLNEYHTFWSFLKTKPEYGLSGWVGTYKVHRDGLARLDKLLGPNYVTIVKAYMVRNKR